MFVVLAAEKSSR